jgi:hypothetical protein
VAALTNPSIQHLVAGTVIVWDLDRGHAIAFWHADFAVTAIGWSDRVSTVIAGDSGGGVHVLRLKPDAPDSGCQV